MLFLHFCHLVQRVKHGFLCEAKPLVSPPPPPDSSHLLLALKIATLAGGGGTPL